MVLIFASIEGVRPMVSWLELPLILGMLALVSAGVAMLLSALFVRFRDISPIWEVASQILFYASPVILPAEAVHRELAHGAVDQILYRIYTLNPLVDDLPAVPPRDDQQRDIWSAGQVMGSWLWLLAPVGDRVRTFVLGFWYFNREAPRIAEDL